MKHSILIKNLFVIFTLLFILIGCSVQGESDPIVTPQSTETLTPFAPEPVTPTVTPLPLAAIVNGEEILLSDFNLEVAQFQAALAEKEEVLSEEEVQNFVLNELIDQTLLSQSARKNGYTADEQMLNDKIADLAAEIGEMDALQEWIAASGYSEEQFRLVLKRNMEAGWQRNQIIEELPENIEQIHARQILVFDRDSIDDVYATLELGFEFKDLAFLYDPQTGGDLGWFPRGFLYLPEIEEVAYDLQQGEYSEIIETDYGFHIIYVEARSTEQPLAVDAKLKLQFNLIADWMQQERDSSEIINLIL
ncbi:MAG: SurA N-terminal domain-containing protein [Anaerolineaceae bacterium]|nr:SurA N-terminal domain-containing protein [Anaerolineaceae bacterium]